MSMISDMIRGNKQKQILKRHTDVLSENFTIEDSSKGKYGLEILESLHQKVKKPAIGIQQQSTPLLSFE